MLMNSRSAAGIIHRMVDTLTGIEGIRVTLGPSESTNGNAAGAIVISAPAAGPGGHDQTLLLDGVAVFTDPDIARLLKDKLLEVNSAPTNCLLHAGRPAPVVHTSRSSGGMP